MVRYGNFLYFLPIFVLFSALFLAHLLTNRFGKRFSRRLILILVWSNFALHIVKQFTPYYFNRWPSSLSESSATNFCALLIMVWPFIFLGNNKYLKDYAYYVGMLSALAAYFIPTGPLNLDLSSIENFFEVVRFYGCHAPLLICGYLMVKDGFHKLDYHRLWAIPLVMVAFNLVVLLNGFFLYAIQFPGYTQDLAVLTARDGWLSGAAVFGPPPFVDKFLAPLYRISIPGLQVYYVNGEMYFTPALWMLPALYVVVLLIGPLLTYPWQKHQMKADFEGFKQKIKMRRKSR